MEQANRSAWEEQEKLSRALEDERKGNMKNVMSTIQKNMKDQKMKLLKQIKLLNDEKNIFSSKFKECKENCNKLKTLLDQKMAEYQRLQAEYDALSSAAGK
jgi:predicted transcriptional regulator